MTAWKTFNPDEADFIRFTLELLADIRDPLDAEESEEQQQQRLDMESAANTYQSKLEALQTEKVQALREEDYERASIIKKQIVEVVEAIDALEADMVLFFFFVTFFLLFFLFLRMFPKFRILMTQM
jgi:hypothetical protein